MQRIKLKQKSLKIQMNDVVIIYDEKQPKHLWQMGKVVKLLAGDDGVVRAASVKLAKTSNVINRPVNKLYPLLTDINENVDSS